jgi:hypothetical protein
MHDYFLEKYPMHLTRLLHVSLHRGKTSSPFYARQEKKDRKTFSTKETPLGM